MFLSEKSGSYNASYYDDTKMEQEILRLTQEVTYDKKNLYKCIELIGFYGEKTLLDLGCGPGATSVMIGECNPSGNVIGLDREARFIRYGRKYISQNELNNIEIIEANCENMPFENNKFDCCFSRYVFQHLPNPKKALAEMIRVTKPSGKIGIYEWDEGLCCIYPEPRYYRKYINAEITRRRFSGGDLFMGRKLYTMFREAGLQDINVLQLYINSDHPGRNALENGHSWYEGSHDVHPYVKMNLITDDELKTFYSDLRDTMFQLR